MKCQSVIAFVLGYAIGYAVAMSSAVLMVDYFWRRRNT